MSAKRYTDEFKIEAVRQIVEYGRPVAEVAERLGVSVHSLYGWRRQQGKSAVVRRVESDQNAEVRRLKAELRRVIEERGILKKAAAYLAVVLDLFSRQVVGWATRPTQHTDLVLQALLAAVWRRKLEPGLLLRSDQGSQFTSEDWQSFPKAHGIVCSMSRRGNCHDNAAMESFFQSLKREHIKQRIYSTHADARAMCSTTSSCSTTLSGGTVLTMAYPR